MAFDAELFHAFDPAVSKPTFRVYGWEPPAISIGRFQKPEDFLNLDACALKNIPVVRRITGGGAIFHAREVTYSFVCPASFVPAEYSIGESFKFLTSFLIRLYASLGLEARYAIETSSLPASELGKPSAICYAGQERYDILVGGKKLGGNAQRRTRDVIFQHGSIPLERVDDIFDGCMKSVAVSGVAGRTAPFGSAQAKPFDSAKKDANSTTLAELGVKRDFDDLAERVIGAWNETMGR